MDPSSTTMEIKKNRHSGSESCPFWLFFPWKIHFPPWIRRQRPWKSRKIVILDRNRARSGCFSHGKSIFRHGSVVNDHGNQEKSSFWIGIPLILVVLSHGKPVFRHGSVVNDHGNQEKSSFWVGIAL